MYWLLRLLVHLGKYRVDENGYEIMDQMLKIAPNIFGHVTNLKNCKKFGKIKKTKGNRRNIMKIVSKT